MSLDKSMQKIMRENGCVFPRLEDGILEFGSRDDSGFALSLAGTSLQEDAEVVCRNIAKGNYSDQRKAVLAAYVLMSGKREDVLNQLAKANGTSHGSRGIEPVRNTIERAQFMVRELYKPAEVKEEYDSVFYRVKKSVEDRGYRVSMEYDTSEGDDEWFVDAYMKKIVNWHAQAKREGKTLIHIVKNIKMDSSFVRKCFEPEGRGANDIFRACITSEKMDDLDNVISWFIYTNKKEHKYGLTHRIIPQDIEEIEKWREYKGCLPNIPLDMYVKDYTGPLCKDGFVETKDGGYRRDKNKPGYQKKSIVFRLPGSLKPVDVHFQTFHMLVEGKRDHHAYKASKE